MTTPTTSTGKRLAQDTHDRLVDAVDDEIITRIEQEARAMERVRLRAAFAAEGFEYAVNETGDWMVAIALILADQEPEP